MYDVASILALYEHFKAAGATQCVTHACRLVCAPAGPHAHSICMFCSSAQQAMMANQLGRPIGASQRHPAEWQALLSYLLCARRLGGPFWRRGARWQHSLRKHVCHRALEQPLPEPPAAAAQHPGPPVAKRQQRRRKQEAVCWLHPAAAGAVLQPGQRALLCLRLHKRPDQEGPEVVCCVLAAVMLSCGSN